MHLLTELSTVAQRLHQIHPRKASQRRNPRSIDHMGPLCGHGSKPRRPGGQRRPEVWQSALVVTVPMRLAAGVLHVIAEQDGARGAPNVGQIERLIARIAALVNATRVLR